MTNDQSIYPLPEDQAKSKVRSLQQQRQAVKRQMKGIMKSEIIKSLDTLIDHYGNGNSNIYVIVTDDPNIAKAVDRMKTKLDKQR